MASLKQRLASVEVMTPNSEITEQRECEREDLPARSQCPAPSQGHLREGVRCQQFGHQEEYQHRAGPHFRGTQKAPEPPQKREQQDSATTGAPQLGEDQLPDLPQEHQGQTGGNRKTGRRMIIL